MDIRVICAIGQSGQLGLDGGMPWEGSEDRVYVEDVERFFEITRGHVLICGPKTVASFPDFAHNDRTIVTIRSSDDPEDVLSRFAERVVFVGGGPAVWDVYAKYVRHWDINRLPYDGEADTWFDPAWLLAGGRHTIRR
ncbi:dihydrofolate reductase [Fulvimarina pelagi HTCC2506]|uniref:Dihydrofolate reductase n=1 Tax=Fulvimarina pelagi HTCC2506 TaxID=314231 RepID=Q0G5B9_9HYPH|nr:dihydrofolate reductase [Fulvimarina pelagi]EAU43145.1 dihydrofolate reductase [Fulvimarina pelagi HTCC2506]